MIFRRLKPKLELKPDGFYVHRKEIQFLSHQILKYRKVSKFKCENIISHFNPKSLNDYLKIINMLTRELIICKNNAKKNRMKSLVIHSMAKDTEFNRGLNTRCI